MYPDTPFLPVNKSRLVVPLCCLILLSGGCSALQELAGLQKPRLSVTDVRVTGFDFSGLDMAFDVTVDNPNALSLQMLSYDYNLAINRRTFVSGRQAEETRIEASGQSTFRVPVRLGFREVYETFGYLAGSDGAAYAFNSTFAFDLPGLGRTEVPVRTEGEIPLLRLPAVRITRLQVDEVGFSGANLTLGLEFDNPNGIGFNINSFDYSLDINSNRWAEGSALDGIAIAEKGVTQLAVPIELNIARVGSSVLNLLSGSQDVDYELKGNLSLGANHPLLGRTDLTIDREGRVRLAR